MTNSIYTLLITNAPVVALIVIWTNNNNSNDNRQATIETNNTPDIKTQHLSKQATAFAKEEQLLKPSFITILIGIASGAAGTHA